MRLRAEETRRQFLQLQDLYTESRIVKESQLGVLAPRALGNPFGHWHPRFAYALYLGERSLRKAAVPSMTPLLRTGGRDDHRRSIHFASRHPAGWVVEACDAIYARTW